MNVILVILSFIFFLAPGIFLLVASISYQKWWKEEVLDKIDNKTIVNNGITLSQITGSVFSAIGLILVTIGLFEKKDRDHYKHRTHERIVVELKNTINGKKQHIGKGGKIYVLKRTSSGKYRRVYI